MIPLNKIVVFLLSIGVLLVIVASVEATGFHEEEDKSSNTEIGAADKHTRYSRDATNHRRKNLITTTTTTTKKPKLTTTTTSKPSSTTTTKKSSASTSTPEDKTTSEPKTNDRKPTMPDSGDDEDDNDRRELVRLQRDQDEERDILMSMDKAVNKWSKWLRSHNRKSLNKIRASKYVEKFKSILRDNKIVSIRIPRRYYGSE